MVQIITILIKSCGKYSDGKYIEDISQQIEFEQMNANGN